MNFEIVYHESVAKEDIPRLSGSMKVLICRAIETRLMTHPEFYEKPLRQSLAGYRKLRVGDWRIVFRIERKKVKIFLIMHRSQVYKHAEKRISLSL